MLPPTAADASTITVQWSGPSKAVWDAAKEDYSNGGFGDVEGTEYYQGCTVRFGPLCTYLWNQGLAVGGGGFPPELFVDDFGSVGFGLNVVQSMPDFSIYAECKPDLFQPCYTTFTPLSMDWDFYGGSGGLAPFVWLSSKGGVMVVGENWDGQFGGSLWENIISIQGVYGCLYFDDPELICTDDFSNPYIRGMTIEVNQVPEPTSLTLWSVGVAIACARLRKNTRRNFHVL
jgi:hypothetical protein